jgi:hypothetical protein
MARIRRNLDAGHIYIHLEDLLFGLTEVESGLREKGLDQGANTVKAIVKDLRTRLGGK